jgi:hypothetical protein
LNSLWGKFGQRNNLTKTALLKSPADYFSLVLDKKIDIAQIMPVGEEMMRVTYREKDSYIRENASSNVVVALYTTRLLLLFIYPAYNIIFSAARLKLYEYMQMVQRSPGCHICYTGKNSCLYNFSYYNFL